MERLRNQLGDPDPDRALAARLMASMKIEDLTDERSARIQRVLRRASRVRARAWWLRPAVLAVAMLGVVSVALASSASVRQLVERWLSPAARAPAAPAERQPSWPPAPAVTPEVPPIAPPTAPPAPSAATPEPPRAPAAAPASSSHRASIPKSPDPAAALRGQPRTAEVIALENAIKSLRRDRDPDRAAMFLSFYIGRFRSGRFLEEAYALAVEAATARHAVNTPQIAGRYLRRFPQGRYRRMAERAAASEHAGK